VAKITGKEGETFSGTALVYDSEELMMAALDRKEIKAGNTIYIFIYICISCLIHVYTYVYQATW
jgi:dihydroxyacid dehydratase/phosphogluconate dehydratase